MPKILIIDNKEDNLISMKALLRNLMEDVEISTAFNGVSGINIAKQEQPDLILLDIFMPEMDGFAVCEKLKKNKLTKQIPIIMITAIKADKANRVKGLELGADAFLSKPIDETELVTQIKVMFRIKAAEDHLRVKNKDLEKLIKKQSVELEEINEQYKSLVDNSLEGLYIIQNERIHFHNQKFAEILGYNKKTNLIGKPIMNFVAPESQKLVKEMVKRRENGQLDSTHYNFWGLKADGAKILIESLGGRIFIDGNPAVQGALRDITEMSTLDDQVRKLSRAVDQSPISIIITDLRGKIEYVNSSFLRTTGYNLNELIGKSSSILKTGHTKADEYKKLWQTILDGNEWKGQFLNKRKNGELFWEAASISPIKDQDGIITHFLGVKEDISERKRLENELIYAKEKAEEADKLKTSFLANMSHEIRTPMNAIMGFSNLLVDEGMTIDERLEYVDLINSNSKTLLKLIDDIFDIARIEAGQLNVTNSDFDFKNILLELHANFNQFTIKKGGDKLKFELVFPEVEYEGNIHCDPHRLKQILSNLIGNAIKYTEKGSIKLGYNIIPANASITRRPSLQFYVKDTGIGIPQNKMQLIFDRFRQADDSHTREYGGTGLGLAISKNIAQLLGGNLYAVSSVGKGSVFYLTIPLQEGKVEMPQSKIPDAKPQLDWKTKTLLVAEDVESNFQLIETLLRRTGIKIIWVKNGEEAIATVQKTEGIDLILMDIQMPILNGYDATKAIKNTHKNMPIIAVTAFALEGDKEKMLDAGCDDYIAKPIKSKELYTKMGCFLDK
ncbi:MAG: response regulator [Bacteroidetes bacterium]|nr:response regulator [Bacteroidota bacterium]